MRQRTRLHRSMRRALLMMLLPCVLGCDVQTAREVQTRYAGERWIHRASLKRAQIYQGRGSEEKALWQDVAWFYGNALAVLPELLGRSRPRTPLQADQQRLTNQATLGRIEALRELGFDDQALALAHTLHDESTQWRGTRGRAALEVARCLDTGASWEEALRAYHYWCSGVRDGDWPLHRSELEVPGYVSRRLGDRGQQSERHAWVSLASEALGAAAKRDENARDARYARFLLLLKSEHWDAALQALRVTRQIHDPDATDGGLVLAEANLLAGALHDPNQAIGLLTGLYSEDSAYSVQYRVAAMLMAGQIHMRQGNLDAAEEHYQHASSSARSSLGRAEATLGLARVNAAQGKIELASRYYTELRRSWPATAAGLLASLEEYRLLSRHGMQVEAETVLSQAFDHYRAVIANFGTELPALRAAGYLSEVLGHSQTWDEGVAFLDSIANTYSEDPRAGTLLLRAARIAAQHLDDPQRAQLLLNCVEQRYPDSDLAVAIRPFADSLRSTLLAP